MESYVDNYSLREKKRYQLICQIKTFLEEGCSYREISRRLGVGRNTIAKYRAGDPGELCRSGIQHSKLDVYFEEIQYCLFNGYSKSRTVKYLFSKGYAGARSTAYDYLCKMELLLDRHFAPQPYVRTKTEAMKYKTGSKGKEKDYLTRSGIFRWLWMDETLLMRDHIDYLFREYPKIAEIRKCIHHFRKIFYTRNMPELYLFIERYRSCDIAEIRTFAKGLHRDIEAVENAVASDLSNGFVEGTNNKLKMIKRTMFGRCKSKLLSAKLMLQSIY